MKKFALWFIIVALGSVGLVSCGHRTDEPPRANLLLVGQARLRRAHWNAETYVPVVPGTLIYAGDQLQVEGPITLLCAGPSLQTLDKSGPCPCSPQGWVRGGQLGGSGLRGSSSDVPYILLPRNTWILEDRPQLRWHASGASSYDVSIVTDDGTATWTQATVAGDSLRYPDNAPSLQAGKVYLLEVRDNDTSRHSSQDPARGLSFQLLAGQVRQETEWQRDKILKLDGLDEPARQLALGMYYARLIVPGSSRGLYADAWGMLEAAAPLYGAPAIYVQLGDVLAALKLPDEAAAAYQSGLELAEAGGNLESLADAHAGLWRCSGSSAHYQEAHKLYKQLGDEQKLELLK